MIKQKVAIITGAAKGIGHEIAFQLAEDGCAIAIFDILSQEEAKDNFYRIRKVGVPTFYFQGDIRNNLARNKFSQAVFNEFGRIDFLVNNTGVAPQERTDILKMTEESFDFVMDINLKATFFLTQSIVNLILEKGIERRKITPKVVNISSISSYTSSTSRGEYCISKAGVSMLTKLFADRLAKYGINVYEVRPGIICTDMTKTVKNKYDKLISNGLTPIKRWGYPEDVAKVVSVLCSGNFDFSTGEVINVDGGFHLRRL